MMLLQEKLYTAKEFWEIAQLPENADKRLELIDGVIVEMASSSQKNTVIGMRIGYFLNAFVIPRDLGYVTGADGGFTITEKNAFQPDVAFISKARHAELKGVEFPIAPDLAVEVISPSESSNAVLKKVQRYIQGGTSLVVTIYPDDQTVRLWRPSTEGGINMQTLTIDEVWDASDVLTGFSLKVSEIFPK
jgi:Uma2 family endonuclease